MPAQENYVGSVESVGEGTIEFVKVKMELSQRERREFLKSPQRYYERFLKAHGHRTNAFIVDAASLKIMIRTVTRSTRPVDVFMTIHAHVTRPKKYHSHRIVIVTN